MDGAGVHEQEDGELFFAFLLLLYLCYKEIKKNKKKNMRCKKWLEW